MSKDKKIDDVMIHGKNSKELKGISIVGKIVGLFVVVWLVSISYYAFGFFVLGMLPSLIAFSMDRGAGRFASQTISACNFTGIVPFLFDIALNYERSLAAREIMADPFTWVVVYGFAIIGLMMIFVLPNITSIIFALKAEYRLQKLLTQQEAIVEEWGEAIKKG